MITVQFAVAMGFLIFMLSMWNAHEVKNTCNYCGGYKGKHDDHCPYQGSGLIG